MLNNSVRAYTDGSYIQQTQQAAWAFVIVNDADKIIAEAAGRIHSNALKEKAPLSLEMFAVAQAVLWAERNKIYNIVIHYDAEAIEHHLVKTKHPHNVFLKFRQFIDHKRQQMFIGFIKVKAHYGNPFNNRADKLAYRAAKGKLNP